MNVATMSIRLQESAADSASRYVAAVRDAESQEKNTSPIAATPSAMTDWAVVRNRPTADPASSPVTPLLPTTVLIRAG